MESVNADVHLLSSLDDIAWLFNIRGNDVAFCPVVLAFRCGGGSSSSTGGGEAVPPSQDIQGGATAQAPGSESGLTVADLPSWLNPTGAEPAA